jgi:hypothetical protein
MKTMKEYLSTPEGMKQMWEKVNEVLDNFDFTKLIVTMEALDWGWACTEAEAEEYESAGCVTKWYDETPRGWRFWPQYPQLMQYARRLLVQCIEDMPEDETEWSVSTGGFMAKAYISTDEERAEYYGAEVANVDDFAHSVDLSLYFIVEESTSY